MSSSKKPQLSAPQAVSSIDEVPTDGNTTKAAETGKVAKSKTVKHKHKRKHTNRQDDFADPPRSVLIRFLRVCLLPFDIALAPLDRLFQWLFNPREVFDYPDYNHSRHKVHSAHRKHSNSWSRLPKRLKSFLTGLATRFKDGLRGAPKFLWHVLRQDQRGLLYVLPAASMLLFFAYVFYQAVLNAEAIERKYRLGAQSAIAAGDYALAKTYFPRLAKFADLSSRDQLQWALVLGQTGDYQKAQRILADLAPDNARGYPPAHRLQALKLLAELNEAKDPQVLRRLRWHLEKGNDNSEAILKAWAAYYLAVNDQQGALESLRRASAASPELLIAMADILRSQQRTPEMQATLTTAAQRFEHIVSRDLQDTEARLHWATALIRLEDYAAAERVLKAGYALQPDTSLAQALADYYIIRYDQAPLGDTELQARFDWLRKGLAVVPNHPASFRRISELHARSATPADATWIKEALMDIVTSGQPSAVAHIALSNVLWQEENFADARWHVEQAYRLEPQSVSVLNNLAWMIAHHEPPDLDRALELAQIALEKSPHDPNLQDTYGTVLMLREEYEQAIVQFEKALRSPGLASELHRKLAECYRHLDKPELARLHDEKSRPPSGRVRL